MTFNKPCKIIIVEDHAFTRKGASTYLKTQEQLEIIGEFAETRSLRNDSFNLVPDIILLDLNLPGLNGEVSCKFLKEKFPYCKIIAFTEHQKTEKELIDLGFDGRYLKGEDTAALIEVIEHVLNNEKYFGNTIDVNTKLNPPDKTLNTYLEKIKISPREIEIIKLYLQDFTSKQIGEKLFISEKTVNTHKRNFKSKSGKTKKSEIRNFLEQNGHYN